MTPICHSCALWHIYEKSKDKMKYEYCFKGSMNPKTLGRKHDVKIGPGAYPDKCEYFIAKEENGKKSL